MLCGRDLTVVLSDPCVDVDRSGVVQYWFLTTPVSPYRSFIWERCRSTLVVGFSAAGYGEMERTGSRRNNFEVFIFSRFYFLKMKPNETTPISPSTVVSYGNNAAVR